MMLTPEAVRHVYKRGATTVKELHRVGWLSRRRHIEAELADTWSAEQEERKMEQHLLTMDELRGKMAQIDATSHELWSKLDQLEKQVAVVAEEET
jgi:hypothetical protein